MRHSIFASLSLVTLLASPALATGPLDGTWKIDLGATKLPTKPDVFLLEKGSFTCSSCTPAYTIKADGITHPVAGHDYYDAASVEVVDAHTVVQRSGKAGKIGFKLVNSISADGNTLTYEFTDTSAPNGVPVTGKGVETRVAPAPAGAHVISGSWRTTSMTNMSDSGLTISFLTTPRHDQHDEPDRPILHRALRRPARADQGRPGDDDGGGGQDRYAWLRRDGYAQGQGRQHRDGRDRPRRQDVDWSPSRT